MTTIKVRNVGTLAWQKGQVKMRINGYAGTISGFHDVTWPADDGMHDFEEETVGVDEEATFKIVLHSNLTTGLTMISMRPVIAGLNEFLPEDMEIRQGLFGAIDVIAPLAGEVESHTWPPAVLNVWSPETKVRITNIGTKTWKKSNTFIADFPEDGTPVSDFRHSSWMAKRSIVKMDETEVTPGQTATFNFVFSAPQVAGQYEHSMRLISNNEWVPLNGKLDYKIETRVDTP